MCSAIRHNCLSERRPDTRQQGKFGGSSAVDIDEIRHWRRVRGRLEVSDHGSSQGST
jgi:hypothetical protein